MTAWIEKFLAAVKAIFDSKPAYKQPGDGSNGVCDCIGLIIGAIRRIGLKWSGIHGSNWAARKEIVKLEHIDSASDLKVGDAVFKAYEKGDSRWSLPARYRAGGRYCNGDLRDYYHVGVVTSVNPLRITHMTSPTARVDTRLGSWAYHGQLSILVKAAGGSASQSVSPSVPTQTGSSSGMDDKTPATGKTAVVTAQTGKYVKMRQYPSTNCSTWDNVPVGATVTLVQPGETWAQISYGRRKNWYMMAKFLDVKD